MGGREARRMCSRLNLRTMMCKRKGLVLMALSLVCSLPAYSQGLWQRFTAWLTEGSDVDTAYIYERPARLTLSLDASVMHVSADMGAEFTLLYTATDGDQTITEQLPATISNTLSRSINGGLGASIGYGKLGIGYGFDLGPANSAGNGSASFGYQGHKWGIAMNYYGVSRRATHSVQVGNDSTHYSLSYQTPTAEAASVQRLSGDAYWIIRRDRFAYTAA